MPVQIFPLAAISIFAVAKLAKIKMVAGDRLSEICRGLWLRVCRVGWKPCLSAARTVWGRRIPPDLGSGMLYAQLPSLCPIEFRPYGRTTLPELVEWGADELAGSGE